MLWNAVFTTIWIIKKCTYWKQTKKWLFFKFIYLLAGSEKIVDHEKMSCISAGTNVSTINQYILYFILNLISFTALIKNNIKLSWTTEQ